MANNIIKHRRGTTQEWLEVDLTPEDGELVIEECADGSRKCKIGNGLYPFSKLPYIEDGLRRQLLEELGNLGTDFAAELQEVRTTLTAQVTNTSAEMSKLLEQTKSVLEQRISDDVLAVLNDTNSKFISSEAGLRSEMQEKVDAVTTELSDSTEKLNLRIDGVESTFDTKIAGAWDTTKELVADTAAKLATDYTNKIKAEALSHQVTTKTLQANIDQVAKTIDDHIHPAIQDLDVKHTTAVESLAKAHTETEERLIGELAAKTDEVAKELDAHKADVDKVIADQVKLVQDDYNSKIDTATRNTEKAIEDTSAALSTQITQVRTDTETSLETKEQELLVKLEIVRNSLTIAANGLDAAVKDLEEKGIQLSTDTAAAITDLLSKVALLGETDSAIAADVQELNDDLDAAVLEINSKIAEISGDQTTGVALALTEVNRLEEAQHAADAVLLENTLTAITQIYVELADLVDDDLLILNKIYAVEVSLRDRLSAIRSELDGKITNAGVESTQAVNDVRNELLEALEVVESDINSAVATANTAITKSIEDLKSSTSVKISDNSTAITTLANTLQQLTTDTANNFTAVTAEIDRKHNAALSSIRSVNRKITELQDDINVTNEILESQSKRISRIVALKQGSTTGDAELLDIRTGYNGLSHPTAGDAVRAVGKDLNSLRDSLSQYIDSQAVDGLRYDYTGEVGLMQPYMLYLTAKDEVIPETGVQIISGAGGGGGGAGAGSLSISYITNSPLVVTTTDDAKLYFTFSGTDSSGDTIQQANAVWKVNGATVEYGTINNGENFFDVKKYLTVGTTKVHLTVTDDNGGVATKSWSVQQIELSVSSNFDDMSTYPTNKEIVFTYTPFGAVDKTAVFMLDGQIWERVELTSDVSGIESRVVLPPRNHGAHLLEFYLEATVNNKPISSEHVTKEILWYDPAQTAPVIGTQIQSAKMKQYATTSIVYTVYDPKTETPEVIIEVDNEEVSRTTLKANASYNNTPTDVYSYTESEVGEHVVRIICGSTVKEVPVTVENLGFKVEPITAGLVFDFNPAGRSNADTANRLWTNGTVSMRVSDNFDWINGGYIPDDPDGPCFCVKAGATATIDYKLFETEAKGSGKEFKLVFKTKNVANPEAVFLSCVDNTTARDHIGLEMGVHEARIYAKNKTLDVAYSEDDVIEFEFNISKNTEKVPMVMGYEDGVPSRPMVYEDSDSFKQNTAKEIVIGSPDCDVYIYRFKVYNSSLTNVDILNNFIADARTADEMIARYLRNRIYDENNKLTPEALAEKCPWLRVYKISAPHFTNNKSDKVTGTTIQQLYKQGDPVLDNWICYNAQHSGQGTSSNNYGAAGRNLDFIMNKSGIEGVKPHFELGDGSTAKVITLTRKSVPVAYLNAKVNIASSNNLTNAILANRYNKFNPYRRPFVARDGINTEYIKDTMEFHNCVIFIQETDPDISTHREFADNEWHFYAIGNIGDSKKTDDTRATDPGDKFECCVEIMDVGLPLSDFPVDTMINAMEYKHDEVTGEKIYKWAKNENLALLYERSYALTADTEVNLNKTYYIDLPVKVEASPAQITIDNLPNLFDRAYVKTADTTVVDGKVYYSDAEGTVLKKDQLALITNPSEADLYEWQRGYKKTTDTAIIENKLYYVEVLQKSDAMEYTYEDRREYPYATDDNLANLYEFIDGQYTLTQDTTVDLDKTYYLKQVIKDADGNITEVSYLSAMAYITTKVKVYTYATNDNLGRLYEGAYFKTADTEVDLTKTYYIDILVNDDFSEDYTYGWRYISDEDDPEVVDFCKQKWIDFYRFVTTSTDAEFKARLSDYFVIDSALYYYLFTTRYCMVDNRAKNTFWHYGKASDGSRKWDLCWDYDNDTSLGLNNYGKQVYRYGLEDIDRDDAGEEVFRESDSLFFCRIRDLFSAELKAMYKDLESKNAWHAESFLNACDAWQNEFPEELWRIDIERKYLRTYTSSFINKGGDAQFLVNMCNGRMKYHRRQWERSQEQYMASKYQTIRSSSDEYHANFRVNRFDDASSLAVKPNYQLTLTPFSHIYLNVWYGDVTRTPFTVRAEPNIPTPVPCPSALEADIINVGSASAIRDFGDLSACYPKTASIGNASRVKKLILGNDTPGYNNNAFTTLTTGANPLLEDINVENISSLEQTLDLSGLTNLKSLKAFGTNVPSVTFAKGGKVNYVELPAVNDITLHELKCLSTDNFKLSAYDNVTSLIIEDCPLIDQAVLLDRCTNLTHARLIGIDFDYTTYEYLKTRLFHVKGRTTTGDETENATIDGSAKFANLTGAQFNELVRRYPNLTIHYDNLVSTITFKDTDQTTTIHENTTINAADYRNPVHYADTEVPADKIAKPVKQSIAEFSYKFIGWSTDPGLILPEVRSTDDESIIAEVDRYYREDTVKRVEGDRVLYPVFRQVRRIYTIKFYNQTITSGSTLLCSVEVPYGDDAEYPGLTPAKQDAASPELYTFTGWHPKPESIKGHMECYAQFTILDDKWYTIGINDISDCVDRNDNVFNGYTLDNAAGTMSITTCNNKFNQAVKVPAQMDILRESFRPHEDLTIQIEDGAYDKVSFDYKAKSGTELCFGLYNADLSKCFGPFTINVSATGSVATGINIEAQTNGYKRVTLTLAELAVSNNQPGRDNIPDTTAKLMFLGAATTATGYVDHVTVSNAVVELTHLVNNYTVVSVGGFTEHNSLELVNLPETITEIQSRAFYNCYSMFEVDIPKSVKTIGANAFQNCSRLKKLVIPAGVTSLGQAAIADCRLDELIVEPGNKRYVMRNNCLIDTESNTLVQGLTSGTIPDDISKLGAYCFSNTDILSAVIPEGITTVSSNAFSRCSKLLSVTLPSTITTLDATCFAWCPELRIIQLPPKLTSIKTYVFDSCSLSMVTIPSKVTAVLERAFGDMPTLKSVTFETTAVPEIHEEAFKSSGCGTEDNPMVIKTTWKSTDTPKAPWGADGYAKVIFNDATHTYKDGVLINAQNS